MAGGVRFYLALRGPGPEEARWAKKQVLLDLHLPRMLRAAIEAEFPGECRVTTDARDGIYRVSDKDGATLLSLLQDPNDEYTLLLEQGTAQVAEFATVHRIASTLKARLETILDTRVRTEIYAVL